MLTLSNKEHIDPYLQDDGRPANKDPTDCTTVYQSGNARAKRHQAYDIQGVGSLVCRHYFVLGIFHLWHGERYGYILGLLVWFVAMATARGVDLNGAVIPFFYDVACRFKPYFDKHAPEDIKGLFDFVTGKVHGITHSAPCQLQNNCLYHAGSTDYSGEGCETVWAAACKNAPVAKYLTLLNYFRCWDRYFAYQNQLAVLRLASLLLTVGKRVHSTLKVCGGFLPPFYI